MRMCAENGLSDNKGKCKLTHMYDVPVCVRAHKHTRTCTHAHVHTHAHHVRSHSARASSYYVIVHSIYRTHTFMLCIFIHSTMCSASTIVSFVRCTCSDIPVGYRVADILAQFLCTCTVHLYTYHAHCSRATPRACVWCDTSLQYTHPHRRWDIAARRCESISYYVCTYKNIPTNNAVADWRGICFNIETWSICERLGRPVGKLCSRLPPRTYPCGAQCRASSATTHAREQDLTCSHTLIPASLGKAIDRFTGRKFSHAKGAG